MDLNNLQASKYYDIIIIYEEHSIALEERKNDCSR